MATYERIDCNICDTTLGDESDYKGDICDVCAFHICYGCCDLVKSEAEMKAKYGEYAFEDRGYWWVCTECASNYDIIKCSQCDEAIGKGVYWEGDHCAICTEDICMNANSHESKCGTLITDKAWMDYHFPNSYEATYDQWWVCNRCHPSR